MLHRLLIFLILNNSNNNINFFNVGDLNSANQLSMGTVVTTMVQTVEHYFMQFNTKTRGENRKSPIQVTKKFEVYLF